MIEWLKYYHNTLIDGARVIIDVPNTNHEANCNIDFITGKVHGNIPNQLINKEQTRQNNANNIANQNNPNWQNINEVAVLIAPFYLSPKQDGNLVGQNQIIYPFWIKAILNRKGNLSVNDDTTFPYIPRDYLEPQVNQDTNYTFSSVEKVDNVISLFNGNSWNDYWTYIKTCFLSITYVNIQNYKVENYNVVNKNTIVVNTNISGVTDHIIKLYNFLIRKQLQQSSLLTNLIDENNSQLNDRIKVTEIDKISLQHLGQMGNKFPLSFSQRKSLFYFLKQKDKEILAINGPPGTGKTTLLQSVVANEVVRSAIEGNAPRLILASSNNNQAVTNIVDSFASIENQNELLYKRWLPNVNSFVLYLPSSSRKIQQNIHYFRFRDAGSFPNRVENIQYLTNAEKLFVQNFKNHSNINHNTVSSIVDNLRNEIINHEINLQNGIKLWQKIKALPKLIDKLGLDSNSLLIGTNLNLSKLKVYENNLKTIEKELSIYLDSESIWIRLFSFLKFVKEKRITRFKQIFRECKISYQPNIFNNITSIHNFFDSKFKIFKNIISSFDEWNKWKEIYDLKGDPPLDSKEFKKLDENNIPYFYDELETTLKYKLFYLAIHYWEGRWILETRNAIIIGSLNKKNYQFTLERLQRFAMLTPCFVSTFYMAPKFFTYALPAGKDDNNKTIWENPPLLNSIDLLIVDEAGQVSPEIGVATFSLAKKALVVGDVYQIEPVWNVPYKVDYANLVKFNLINTVKNSVRIDELSNKGFLGCSGSIMKLAQKASKFQLANNPDRGMLLTEHRRCYNEIISYCNALAYNGLLEPKRGKSENHILQPMQFIHVNGNSQSVNSSRRNNDEAREIGNWIKYNVDNIISHYQNNENEQASKENRNPSNIILSNIIGIITPFVEQKKLIKSNLRKNDISIDELTIGTVHSLQGAERPIVLFSSVYGDNDIGNNYFFDKGVNMLNVAVSRAKDVFIMFGNKNIFNNNFNPSGKLYSHITQLHN